MDSTLDDFTEENLKTKKHDLDASIVLFSNAMKNAEYLIGRKYAFRKITPKDLLPNAYKQLINKALFVCVSVLLAKYDPEKIKSLNEPLSLQVPLAESIKTDQLLMFFLSYGTNGKANLVYTYNELNLLFSKLIKS